jgi:hypothetical protein
MSWQGRILSLTKLDPIYQKEMRIFMSVPLLLTYSCIGLSLILQ